MSQLNSRALRASIVVVMFMAASSVGAWVATPHQKMSQTTSLEKTVPSAFGDWVEQKNGMAQMSLSVSEDGRLTEDQPYDQVLMRTYRNSKGDSVMLALAYAREQRQEVKIHRPEVCYQAQGYKMLNEQPVEIAQSNNQPDIPGRRLLMNSGDRLEAVSYWVRIGDSYPRSGLGARMTILQTGLKGIVPDAILVRVSSIVNQPADSNTAYERQENFLAQLTQAMQPSDVTMLVAKK